MGELEFIRTLQSYVDPVAVLFAMTTTYMIKTLFFTDKATDTSSLRPGTLINRLFPILPILLAGVYTVVFGYKQFPAEFLVSKSIVSGTMAGYFYRTWKVSVKGE